MISNTLLRLLALLGATVVVTSQQQSGIYGTLSNFDCLCHEPGGCYGFEIELEDIVCDDIAYTFGGSYNRYSSPSREDKLDGSGNRIGCYVRYRAPLGQDGKFSTWTIQAAPGTNPTNGHACYQGGPVGNYDTSGCEHFGVGFRTAQPSKTSYRWLLKVPGTDDQLVADGTNLPLPAVQYSIQNVVNNPAQVAVHAEVEPKERRLPCAQWEAAQWVKVTK